MKLIQQHTQLPPEDNDNTTTHATLRELTPPNAWHLLKNNNQAVLIDVRPTMEYLFVGHPTGAIHIPWIDEPEWTINPEFFDHVIAVIKKTCDKIMCEFDQDVVLICKSNRRSIESGKLLIQRGFNSVSYVSDGFEGKAADDCTRENLGGWCYYDLPWERC